MKKIRKWVLYPGYIIAVTAFFLYVLFPADAAMEYFSGYLGKHYPDYAVTVGTIKPVFPPGVETQLRSHYPFAGKHGLTWNSCISGPGICRFFHHAKQCVLQARPTAVNSGVQLIFKKHLPHIK